MITISLRVALTILRACLVEVITRLEKKLYHNPRGAPPDKNENRHKALTAYRAELTKVQQLIVQWVGDQQVSAADTALMAANILSCGSEGRKPLLEKFPTLVNVPPGNYAHMVEVIFSLTEGG